ncbi:hypothetical protein PG993_011784 [Apiospora rasikravindrae]|uniref:Uncharacterized protein n=1 Tax=Apiospora rasikravindrae TaxID=990691 RepID=A0ABR1S0Q3_9PEZI
MIWATRAEDFCKVKRLSACMVPRGLPLALRVELAGDGAGQAATCQTIGNPCRETGWGYTLDLDRAEGEFITEMAFRPESSPLSRNLCESVKVRVIVTALALTEGWDDSPGKLLAKQTIFADYDQLERSHMGEERDESDWKHVVRAPAGERLVGLAATFGKPGWQHVSIISH